MGQGASIHDDEFIVHSTAVAAGTTDIEPANGIDSADCDEIVFQVLPGTITAAAVTSCKLQQSIAVDGTGDAFSDIIGTAQTIADDDDNTLFVLDIKRPTKRYVRCVVVRGTQNAVLNSIIAIRKGVATRPVTQGATVGGTELHEDAIEGTA